MPWPLRVLLPDGRVWDLCPDVRTGCCATSSQKVCGITPATSWIEERKSEYKNCCYCLDRRYTTLGYREYFFPKNREPGLWTLEIEKVALLYCIIQFRTSVMFFRCPFLDISTLRMCLLKGWPLSNALQMLLPWPSGSVFLSWLAGLTALRHYEHIRGPSTNSHEAFFRELLPTTSMNALEHAW